MDKPGRHHIHQVIKAVIISNRTNQNCKPPDRIQENNRASLQFYFSWNANPEFASEEIPDKSQWRTF